MLPDVAARCEVAVLHLEFVDHGQYLLVVAQFLAREPRHPAQQLRFVDIPIQKAERRARRFLFAVRMIDQQRGQDPSVPLRTMPSGVAHASIPVA